MPLNRWERKERLGFGAQKEIAEKIGVARSAVSAVVNDKDDTLSARTVTRVRKAVARRLGMSVEEVFGNAA